VKLGRDLTRVERAMGRLVLERVAERFGVPARRILRRAHGRGRQGLGRDLVVREVYAALRREAGWSYPKIASFTGRDHSTVLHALRDTPGATRGSGAPPFPLREASENLALLALRAGRVIS
jgi:chromosomal replication initiation ATPase DnaA